MGNCYPPQVSSGYESHTEVGGGGVFSLKYSYPNGSWMFEPGLDETGLKNKILELGLWNPRSSRINEMDHILFLCVKFESGMVLEIEASNNTQETT